ncbi:MAG: class I SAM-dependent methyltransferase [Proteobacteria bacterium]|nr:class I SAM-dependent methyltransferase [Pseudomonadota bacterium]MBU1595514.1 class I SAM-dependent methyltransferase [Pseudomonadota bacterium]
MHETAMDNGKAFFEAYVNGLGGVAIVDVGSRDINGSLREACPPEATYTGVDLVSGKGVDIVAEDPYVLPFPDASQDIVVSTSCFEHDEMFWLTFNEIMRILKPAGLFYLNAPASDAVHRYPVDCWRFYPDSGRALAAWARRSGVNAALLESYVSPPRRALSEDFVAVFVREERHADTHQRRILHTLGSFTHGLIRLPDGSLQPLQAPDAGQRSLFKTGLLRLRARVLRGVPGRGSQNLQP